MTGYAQLRSRALTGMQAQAVEVEVHLANGLPNFTLVGLADTEVKEARERVRSAISNSGLEFPSNKRITVNLAPADLPKDSGRYDLPIALGILAASGQIDSENLHKYEFAGELSLSGSLRSIRGALAMSAAMQRQGLQTALVLPASCATEAALVDAAEVWSAEHLLDVVAHFNPLLQETLENAEELQGLQQVQPNTNATQRVRCPDMADVKGQASAKRALEVAAAGGHSVLMLGPPGSGKSMLAQRLAGLLPPMSNTEALESAAVRSLAGKFHIDEWRQRPTCAPHHSASAVALVGGGSPPKPGEISQAHHAVLFLDELPEFNRNALEALREPLETGKIRISRAAHQAEFPAQFQLIAAMNPCPCGYLGSQKTACRCTPDQISRYQGRISGPLLDRIDIHIEVLPIDSQDLLKAPAGEASADIASRVEKAHATAMARQNHANYLLQGKMLDAHCQLDAAASAFIQKAADQLGWSARAMHRVLRVARTIADLEGKDNISSGHLAEAIQYRRGLFQV